VRATSACPCSRQTPTSSQYKSQDISTHATSQHRPTGQIAIYLYGVWRSDHVLQQDRAGRTLHLNLSRNWRHDVDAAARIARAARVDVAARYDPRPAGAGVCVVQIPHRRQGHAMIMMHADVDTQYMSAPSTVVQECQMRTGRTSIGRSGSDFAGWLVSDRTTHQTSGNGWRRAPAFIAPTPCAARSCGQSVCCT